MAITYRGQPQFRPNWRSKLNRGLWGWWTAGPNKVESESSATGDNFPNIAGNHGVMSTVEPLVNQYSHVLQSDGSKAKSHPGGKGSWNFNTGRLDTADFPPLDETIGNGLTVSAWCFMHNVASANHAVISKWNYPSDKGFILWFGGHATPSSRQFKIEWAYNGTNNTDFLTEAGGSRQANKWLWVCASWSPPHRYLLVYDDAGYLVATDTDSRSNISTTSANLTIAGQFGTTNMFDGALNDIRIWRRYMGVPEALEVYKDSKRGNPRTLYRPSYALRTPPVAGGNAMPQAMHYHRIMRA